MTRTILIGDLHGCLAEAEEFLDKCEATPEDHIVFLGDLVDRGPDSGGCVDLAMRIEARQGKIACVLGNHEEKHLFYDDLEARKGKVDVQVATHVATRLQLRREHYDYFRRLPLYLRLPEHNVVAVHAGVFPNRPIEKQTARHLLHIQCIRPPDEKSVWASKVPQDERDAYKFWTAFWTGPEKVVFGHSVLNKPLVLPNAIGIDGGACFGRELWACVLEAGKPDTIVSVKGRGLDDPSDLTRRGNPNRQVILIHNDVGTY